MILAYRNFNCNIKSFLLFYLIVKVMAPFRWPKIEHNLALVKEYTEASPSKPDEWHEAAKRLSVAFQSEVKGRGCREDLDLLMKKHKANEKKALKR